MFTTLVLSTAILAYPAPHESDPSEKGLAYLGITFEGADAEGGVLVTEVRSDGPAVTSGLRAGDVIRKFNGEPIQFDNFARRIIRCRPGAVVPLEVKRGPDNVTLKVKLGTRPEDFPYPLPAPEVETPDQVEPPEQPKP
jgi:S1-C subfamily serine protease